MTKLPFNKDDKILCIVESPNKKETISGLFKKLGYTHVTVLASVGHITEIKDSKSTYWNTGISPEKGFKINFTVSPTKKKTVEQLKAAVDRASMVILATDLDREGECISWHLKTQLKIPEKKYCRITFHELDKTALQEALENARKIDNNLVDAAKSRSVVDKMIGYRLSPIARTHLSAKSVGRCQSVGLQIVVDREREILSFVPEIYYDLYLHFSKNSQKFRAKYYSFEGKPVKKLKTPEECEKIKKDCGKHDYFVDSVTKKEIKENPKPPFITSTLQQEANKLYGMSVDLTMSCAQKLFEGLNIGGEHIGLITYIRTDDPTMSPEFVKVLNDYVVTNYSEKYKGTLKKAPKSDSAQAGHECLRVTDPTMTVAKLKKYITDTNLLKIYRLIWNRTVASVMAPAIISDTQYNIKNGEHMFVMHSKEIKFDGYRAIYADPEDAISDDETVKETFDVGEKINDPVLKEEKKETTPPKRFTQGTLVKELEKQNVGRPSTYGTIVKTILTEDRGYCEEGKGNEIIPTEKGMALADFLREHLESVINTHYTSDMENKLDEIAKGTLDYNTFLTSFHSDLEKTIKDAHLDTGASTGMICPECGSPMKVRKGPYGLFWGCTNYPKCKAIKKITPSK